MSNGYVIYIVDTETTGLNPVENDVIEISICRLIFDDEGKPTTDQKTWLLKALNPASIEDEALKVNQHKREDILHLTKYGKENYLIPSDVVSDIELWIMEDGASSMDRIFVGQNPNFDIQALQELWKKVGSPGTFPFSLENGNRVIDTKQITTLFDVCVGKRRLYYNLGALVRACGTKKDKSHTASGDVRQTTDLFLFMLDMIRVQVKEKFSSCYLNEDSTET